MIEENEEIEIGFEEPGCAQLSDGDVYIADIDSFVAETGALALQVRDGNLFLLTETLEWVNVEALRTRPTKGPSVVPMKRKSD